MRKSVIAIVSAFAAAALTFAYWQWYQTATGPLPFLLKIILVPAAFLGAVASGHRDILDGRVMKLVIFCIFFGLCYGIILLVALLLRRYGVLKADQKQETR